MKIVSLLSKIVSISCATIFVVGFSFAQNEKWLSCETVISGFNMSDVGSFADVKNLTQNFCKKVFDMKCVDDGDFFDANQSVFLSVLCDNVGAGDNFVGVLREWDDSILKKKTFKNFNIQNLDFSGAVDYCDHNTNVMNGCDLAIHLPNIFNEIINDYFNIGQARIYGIKWLEDDFDATISANEFSKYHFVWLNICDSKSKFYEKSCKYLKNYMKDARNLLTKTKILNTKKMTELNKDINCDNAFTNNLLYCGLLWSKNDFTQSFINVVYNEYLRYRIFMSYYTSNLSQNTKLSNLDTSSALEKLSDNREKIYLAQQQTFKIRQSISMSLRSLSEISGSFPMHIWFTMYQEDANMFMKELVKIYPPIKTLFDKLRNVQEAE